MNKPIFLLGAENPPREYVKFQTMLLERGVPFAGLAQGRLPMHLPDDLSAFAAIAYSARDAHRLASPRDRARLDAFKAAGGRVYPVKYEWLPGTGFVDVHPYLQPTYLEDLVEEIITVHNLPDDMAEIARICSSRSLDDAAREMAECLLGPVTHYFTAWNDAAVNYLRALRSLHRVTGDPKPKQRAIEVAEILCATVPMPPTYGDHIQPMAMLVELANDGWLTSIPLDAMLASMESFLARCEKRGKAICTNIPAIFDVCAEGVAMLTPSLCAMGKACDRPDLTQIGVEHLVESERILRDPADGLWPHGRMGTRQQPVKWSRGMAWATFGASRALAHLDDAPAHRDVILNILRRQVMALAQSQTEHGWWTNIIDMPMSRAESSGTGMHLESLTIAIQNGIDAPEIIRACRAAMRGVKALLWNGHSYANCAGSDIVNTGPLYYLRRPVEMGPPIYLALGLAGYRQLNMDDDDKRNDTATATPSQQQQQQQQQRRVPVRDALFPAAESASEST
jgi:hypothetical protein